MAIELTIKNTFLDVPTLCVMESRRSSSLPRSWKPETFEVMEPATKAPAPRWSDCCEASDVASTMDSECDLITEYEYEYERSPANHESPSSGVSSGDCNELPSSGISSNESDGTTSEHEDEKVAGPFTLCLDDSLTRLTKLSSKARLFEPSMPRDMQNVLYMIQACLSNYRKIFNVQVTDGKLGGTTTIIATYARRSLRSHEMGKILEYVKRTFLDAASKSESTYVMGYSTKPFIAIGKTGFSAKLGSVTAAQRDTTCWDTYRKGFCPRKSICRWCHPVENDVMNVVVMLMEAGGYTQ